MSTTSPISELLAKLGAFQRTARVMVESVPDGPGCHHHHIVGLTREDVQQEVDKLMAAVEAAPGDGLCNFDGPHRIRQGLDTGLYEAVGLTRISVPAMAEVA